MSYFEHQPPLHTDDGTDGFPAKVDSEAQMDDYFQGLNPKKRAKALIALPLTPPSQDTQNLGLVAYALRTQ